MSTEPNSQLIAAAEQGFLKYLREHHIRYTRPRRLILRAVLAIDEYFEAEQLLAELRQAGHRVGKATVYRTLPLLVDCGILRRVRFSDTQTHYACSFLEDPPDHMVCRRCGRIVEFSSAETLALREKVARAHGFKPLSHRFQVSGWCEGCARVEEVNDTAHEARSRQS